MLRATLGLVTAALLLISADAQAAACRNAAGKFIACPSAAAPGQRCRGPSGAFVKCGTPGAKPVTAAKMSTSSKTTTVAAASKPKVKAH